MASREAGQQPSKNPRFEKGDHVIWYGGSTGFGESARVDLVAKGGKKVVSVRFEMNGGGVLSRSGLKIGHFK